VEKTEVERVLEVLSQVFTQVGQDRFLTCREVTKLIRRHGGYRTTGSRVADLIRENKGCLGKPWTKLSRGEVENPLAPGMSLSVLRGLALKSEFVPKRK
jgi:hypothetical protein